MTEPQRCGYATALWLVQQGYMDEAHMELAARGIEANFGRAIEAEREVCAKELDAKAELFKTLPGPTHGAWDRGYEAGVRGAAAKLRERAAKQEG